MFAALVRRGVGAVARDRTATASIFDISRVVTTGASNPTHAAAAPTESHHAPPAPLAAFQPHAAE